MSSFLILSIEISLSDKLKESKTFFVEIGINGFKRIEIFFICSKIV